MEKHFRVWISARYCHLAVSSGLGTPGRRALSVCISAAQQISCKTRACPAVRSPVGNRALSRQRPCRSGVIQATGLVRPGLRVLRDLGAGRVGEPQRPPQRGRSLGGNASASEKGDCTLRATGRGGWWTRRMGGSQPGPRMGWRLPTGRGESGSPARTLKTKQTDQRGEFTQEDDSKPPVCPNAV